MKHRLRTPLYELLRSWQMPMVKAVNMCKDAEQLATDLATFHNWPLEESVKRLNLAGVSNRKDLKYWGVVL